MLGVKRRTRVIEVLNLHIGQMDMNLAFKDGGNFGFDCPKRLMRLMTVKFMLSELKGPLQPFVIL